MINPKTLNKDSDIEFLSKKLLEETKLSVKTIRNDKSAMKQYVNMVNK